MALSMEEQRILDEIEQHLVRSEPGLASRLSALGRAKSARAGRPARARVIVLIAAVIMVAALTVVIYTLVTLRGSTSGTRGSTSGTRGSAATPGNAPVIAPRVSASAQGANGAGSQTSP